MIHSPNEQDHEAASVDLFLKHQLRLIEASAYLDLTPHVVRYRVSGIFRDQAGHIQTPNRIVAKVSRVEVASKFLSPAPEKMLRDLVQAKAITAEQAKLAEQIPLAHDVTVEAEDAFGSLLNLTGRMAKKKMVMELNAEDSAAATRQFEMATAHQLAEADEAPPRTAGSNFSSFSFDTEPSALSPDGNTIAYVTGSEILRPRASVMITVSWGGGAAPTQLSGSCAVL